MTGRDGAPGRSPWGVATTRREVLRGAAMLAAGGGVTALLAACGSGGQGGGSHGDGVLLAGEEQLLLTRNFNPFVAQPRVVTTHGMYEPSMIYNYATKKVVPWLATGYSWSADNLTLTLKIRQGVKWSDGKPFGPGDVAFTFELMKKFPGLLGFASGVWDTYLESVTATQDSVRFGFKDVYTPGFYDLIHQLIVPEHIWSSVGDPVKFTNPDPVATGPFTKVVSFQSQSLRVDRNPDYWQPGKPAIKGIRYSAYAGNQQLTQALITNQLDWGGGYVPNIQKIYVDKDPKHHGFWWPLTGVVNLVVNHARPPFDQLAVRKAFSLAMNRQQMIQTALLGYSKVANATGLAEYLYSNWIDPQTAASGASLMKRDVAAANQLLDQAGFRKGGDGVRRTPDGKPMSYVITVPTGWTDWISDCQVVVDNLKDVGVQVSVTTPAVDAWYDKVYGGDYDMCLGDPGVPGATPFHPYRSLMSSFTYRPVGVSARENWHRYRNSQADALLDEWAKTADSATQQGLAHQLEQLFVQNLPVIPLYYQPEWGAFNTTRVTGFPTEHNAYAPLSNVPVYPTYYIVLTTIKPA
jgi:peptide/nickel transport system substrate-binding protein